MLVTVLQRKYLHIFCCYDLSLFPLYITLRVKLFFIDHFLPCLSAVVYTYPMILLTGHSVQRLADFITVTLNFGLNLGTFDLAMGILARLHFVKLRNMARPNSPDIPPKRNKRYD